MGYLDRSRVEEMGLGPISSVHAPMGIEKGSVASFLFCLCLRQPIRYIKYLIVRLLRTPYIAYSDEP